MVEIAISLAVIGFALVAIIGVLPIGMNVQKLNREETIVNQDANLLMDAICKGAQGLDDLTNYVFAITNTVTEWQYKGSTVHPVPYSTYGYTLAGSYQGVAAMSPMSPPYPLINGYRIVGLLSTPKYAPYSSGNNNGYFSNHVVAYMRSMSGSASEMFPQNNQAVQDLAFSYRLTSEVIPYWTNYFSADPTNYAILNANLHDVRLYFRWPLLSLGNAGLSGQSYRTLAGGQLFQTNEFGFPANNPAYYLYFFQPQTYVP